MNNAKQGKVLALSASILVLAIAIGNIINGFNSNDSTASSAHNKAAVQQNEPELQMVQMKSISNSLEVQDDPTDNLVPTEQRVQYEVRAGDTPWTIAKIVKPTNVTMNDYVSVLLSINENKVLKIGSSLNVPNTDDLKDVVLPSVEIHFDISDSDLIDSIIEAEGSQKYQSTIKSKTLIGYAYSFRNNKYYPYKDKHGNWTIAHGHYLSSIREAQKYSKGISPQAAKKLLTSDMEAVYNDFTLMLKEKNSTNLPSNVQKALFEMTFNMGSGKVKDFKKMWKSLNNGNYVKASKEMKNSYWAKQVGSRADRIVQLVAIEQSTQS